METPQRVEDLGPEYLSHVLGRLLGTDDVQVRGFSLEEEPFQFPRFGDKRFYRIRMSYEGPQGEGEASVVLRVLPSWDPVMALTGDTEHRELKGFLHGIYRQLPPVIHAPYIDVIYAPEREQFWAFMEDVEEDMARLGMTRALDDQTLRTILSHLAAFHAAFWERQEVLGLPWFMRLERPVDYFYRCMADIMDGMREAAPVSRYIVGRWPWLAEGAMALLESLPARSRRWVGALYREPWRLLDRVRGLPRTLCHYDFDNRNLGLRETPLGPVTVVIDWEVMGEGLSAVDVGRLLAYQNLPDPVPYVLHYLDELERHLGRPIDRAQWAYSFDLASIALWQIVGVLWAAMVNAPSSPLAPEMREALRPRVEADIAQVEELVYKHRLLD